MFIDKDAQLSKYSKGNFRIKSLKILQKRPSIRCGSLAFFTVQINCLN